MYLTVVSSSAHVYSGVAKEEVGEESPRLVLLIIMVIRSLRTSHDSSVLGERQAAGNGAQVLSGFSPG